MSAATVLATIALVAPSLSSACTGADTQDKSPTPTPTLAPTPAATRTSTPPPTVSPIPTAPSRTTYTVKPGDTVSSIAQRFGTSVQAIVAASNLENAALIYVGQVLVIPDAEAGGPGEGDSQDLLTIVDKDHGLPLTYVPPNLVEILPEWEAPGFPSQLLREEAADALVAMLQAARAGGHELRVRSAYRSYEEQAVTFQYWVDQLGEEEARRVSAPPGHSEHQLGTAVDLTSASVGWQLVQPFGQTPEGQWLAAHAHEYGFVLSYPQGAEETTGYAYEPWHFRYIGRDEAESWAQTGLTLIEFLKQINAQGSQ